MQDKSTKGPGIRVTVRDESQRQEYRTALERGGQGNEEVAGTTAPVFRIITSPNPFNAKVKIQVEASSSGSYSGKLRVFDIRGRLLLTRSVSLSNGGSYLWDGRNDNGATLASGKYLLLFKPDGSGNVVRSDVVLVK